MNLPWYWWVFIAVALLATGYAVYTSIDSRNKLAQLEGDIASELNPATAAHPMYKSVKRASVYGS